MGLNLTEQLSTQHLQIVALHRPTSDLSQIKLFPVQLVEGDILNPASLKKAVPRNVDAVFHVAAGISMWSGNNARQTWVNVEGSRVAAVQGDHPQHSALGNTDGATEQSSAPPDYPP